MQKKGDIDVYNESNNPNDAIEMMDAYKILGIPNDINKYCCNMILMTTVTLNDLRHF